MLVRISLTHDFTVCGLEVRGLGKHIGLNAFYFLQEAANLASPGLTWEERGLCVVHRLVPVFDL